MSFEADDPAHKAELENDNERIIKLLTAILRGIEIIADAENLLDEVED